ncbi:MAG: glycosyltransferase family 4 protein [Candidatus Cloacimonetes bacterium]|nr:glycosyltransferase family 4 protein [Candidatus Cloacimonadota bacterium]
MNKRPLTIICTARMGHGTFEAKFKPLVQLDSIGRIVVVRKDKGPEISKLSYRILPSLCRNPILNLMITPFVLVREVIRHKADLILAYHYQPHFYFAWIAAKLTGKPYILGQTGTDIQILGSRLIRGWLMRHILRNVLSFNVPGTETYKYWLSKGVPFDRIRVLHSTIDTDYMIPLEMERRYDFVFVGRLTEVKRIDKLILASSELIKEYPQLRICLVGDGHLMKPLKQMRDEYGLRDNLDFVGLQSNIRDWLNSAHAFVMMSDSEGLPCAMMEAMSCGLICIAPMVNNMADLIKQGETGFGFDTSNVGQLTGLMRFVKENRDSLKQIRQNARELIIACHSFNKAKIEWKQVIDRYWERVPEIDCE